MAIWKILGGGGAASPPPPSPPPRTPIAIGAFDKVLKMKPGKKLHFKSIVIKVLQRSEEVLQRSEDRQMTGFTTFIFPYRTAVLE